MPEPTSWTRVHGTEPTEQTTIYKSNSDGDPNTVAKTAMKINVPIEHLGLYAA